MDRKVCILLYSKYSNACIDLLKYIHSLPFDFPSITGLSMMSVDNTLAKDACEKNGIKGVPVLLIEYFSVNNTHRKQMLEKEQIYQWIDEVVNKIVPHKNEMTDFTKSDMSPPVFNGGTKRGEKSRGVTFLNSDNSGDVLPILNISATGESDVIEKSSVSARKSKSAAEIASEMEQQRKLEDEKVAASIKSKKFNS